jgi:predicted pyridoxine 5'-phosphate oxidase superfamily flavin-nucleotide-binding protein
MAKVYECIDAKLASFIEAQPLFFVGTAPLAGDGLVNVSPKGTRGTFKVLDAHTFAYLDLTGSGVETVAHLRENGRICVMFCAFDGGPNIVRLHGTGRIVFREDPGFEDTIAAFGEAGAARRPQARAVILVTVARVSDSCGYAVPKMAFAEERDVLDSWSRNRGPDKLVEYRLAKNATSLDGLPALPA